MLNRILHGTIRKKLAILLLFSVLPAIAVILATGLHNRAKAIEQAKKDLSHFCWHIAESQAKVTLSIKGLLESLADLPEVRGADAESCSSLFASIIRINPAYGALHLVDLQGNLIASGSAREPANFAHTRHFREALATRAFATGEFLIGVTLRTPVFTFGYPVLNAGGEVTGVLLTSIRLDHYRDIFQQSHFPADSFIGVCDHAGRRLFRFPEHPATPVGGPIKAEIFEAARTGPPEGLMEETGSDGVARIHAYRQLKLEEGEAPYMYMFVGAPAAAFYAQAKSQMFHDLRMLFLAIGLTLLCGWYLGGRTVGRRFEEMALAAKRIGDGDLDARVDPAPDIREMDILSQAFNTMAENLSLDIVRREEAEEALRESEQRHKVIFQNSPLGMVLFDSDGTIVDCNPPFVNLMGSSREKLIGFCTARRSSPEMRAALAKALAGECAVFENEYTSVTGGLTRDLRVVFNPINPGGAPAGVIATLEDIGERKRSEKALQESEARFRNLFEQVPSVAVQGYAPDGTTIYWNSASETLYGYTAQEAVGRNLLDLIIPSEAREFVREDMQSMARTGIPIPAGELTLMRKDGSTVLVFSSHVIVKKPDGPQELFCLDIDLSRRQEAENALLLAKEAAEAASQAKSEFLANMSHEIRTPINGVMGMLQLMEMTTLDEEQRQYVHLASSSVNRLSRLLSDILDLSRVEAGRMEIRVAPFDMREVCDAVTALFALTARNKGVDLACRVDPALPGTLLGDETRVRQVLFNLTGNALKFTDAGRVEVAIELLTPEDGGTLHARLSVVDTGIGIPPDRLGEIFEPFRQVENSFTRSYQGAGLGLAIVQRLVGLMDGSIHIESTPGQGTSVTVVLPFRVPDGVRPAPHEPEAVAEQRNLRILLVEDDPSNQLPIQIFMGKAGHETVVAEDGRKAMDILAAEDFDCVLMDIQMPVMDGLEATKAIRASTTLGAKRNIPIIAMTAYAMTGDREKFLDAGMNGYVSKPVDLAQLLRIMEETLGR